MEFHGNVTDVFMTFNLILAISLSVNIQICYGIINASFSKFQVFQTSLAMFCSHFFPSTQISFYSRAVTIDYGVEKYVVDSVNCHRGHASVINLIRPIRLDSQPSSCLPNETSVYQ